MADDSNARFPMPSGLDWSTDFGAGEWEALAAYYQRGTGQDSLNGLAFIPMMHALRPSALKRYRLAIDAGRQRRGDLPDAARAMASLFDHVLLGYEKGILYDLRGSRERGARKADIGHLLSIAWMFGGNNGVHATAEGAGQELDGWDPATDGPGLDWPVGWVSDERVWSCGIDWQAAAAGAPLSAPDVESIAAWHVRVEGAVPQFVPFLARFNPLGMLTYRARYEAAMHGPLPPQFVSLLLLSIATQQEAISRSLHMAKAFGVDRHHVLWMLTRPRVVAAGLATHSDIDLVRVGEILDSWESQNPAP